ncbi:MAG: hypothetical protein DUW69_000652 [Verrucomicrobia bacterium]|jgi:hypothetical protein|nr:MAG: hypothetical protein DUW69_000652 [Verrucomicrobiota bacterium]
MKNLLRNFLTLAVALFCAVWEVVVHGRRHDGTDHL